MTPSSGTYLLEDICLAPVSSPDKSALGKRGQYSGHYPGQGIETSLICQDRKISFDIYKYLLIYNYTAGMLRAYLLFFFPQTNFHFQEAFIMKINDLKPGMKISNDELCEMFKCSSQGGMRRSHATNTLVLISNKIKSVYTDTWEGEVFHYTGMGQKGDQSLTFAQNKTLAESNSNGVVVHLFELAKKNIYTYCGIMKLTGQPYTSTQKDSQGIERKVYIFPLACIS